MPTRADRHDLSPEPAHGSPLPEASVDLGTQEHASAQLGELPLQAQVPDPEALDAFVASGKPEPYTQAYLDGLGYEKLVFGDRKEGKAFLADAEILGQPFVNVDPRYGTDSLGAYQKPDGSIWVESDTQHPAGDAWLCPYRLSLRVPPGRDDSVLLDKHGNLAMPKEGTKPLYGMERGGYATFVHTEGGALQVQATREFFEEFDAARCKGRGTDDLLHDVLEDFRGNGWQVVDCHDMGGGPFTITCEGGDDLPDGKIGYYPHAWQHTKYVTEDPIKAMVERGFVEFSRIKASDFLDQAGINAWKADTNRQLLASGDWEPDQCWPLDAEPVTPEVPPIGGHPIKAYQDLAIRDAEAKNARDYPKGHEVEREFRSMLRQEAGYHEQFEQMTGNAMAAHLAYMGSLEKHLKP